MNKINNMMPKELMKKLSIKSPQIENLSKEKEIVNIYRKKTNGNSMIQKVEKLS